MGFIKDAKVSNMGSDARKAWEGGSPFFTPMLNMPTVRAVGFSGAITDWALMMAAIVEAGWVLHTWAVGVDEKNHPQAMPLFVRP